MLLFYKFHHQVSQWLWISQKDFPYEKWFKLVPGSFFDSLAVDFEAVIFFDNIWKV